MRIIKNILPIFTIALVAAFIHNNVNFGIRSQPLSFLNALNPELGKIKFAVPTIKFGMVIDTFEVATDVIKPNEFLSDILVKYNVPLNVISNLSKTAKNIFDVRHLQCGKKYTVLHNPTAESPDYFIYEPDAYSYVVYDLKNDCVKHIRKAVETKIATATGVVERTLWDAFMDGGIKYSDQLADLMDDALAWNVDFHHVTKGDKFKLVYEKKYIDGQEVGVSNLLGAVFWDESTQKEYYAFKYENANHQGYFDLEGRPQKKTFLKAPLKFSHITSNFNMARLHPVLRYVRPHFGTDYAAPQGTPIMTVADGVVEKAERGGGNGNFVKVKHDKTYETQYLHMSRFAAGIRPGTRVKQGQVIGYVGSTGLATGPHVCFRFWKNGRQVNHLRENLPPPAKMTGEDWIKFNNAIQPIKEQLKNKKYFDEEFASSDSRSHSTSQIHP